MIKTAGKQFDARRPQLYFIAAGPEDLRKASTINHNFLCAVNELRGPKDTDTLREFMAKGANVFIDSGVFALAMDHARAHDMHLYDAMTLAPEHVDGFQKLYDKYVEVCSSLGGDSWGYVEIDQGGRVNKCNTRARLEKLGLRPIPVYHPLSDGWDYFDYLAARYDRICHANVVQAENDERMALISTAYIRQQKYPHLWIHLLGLTPNELVHSCPLQSCDSSTWLSSVRWGFSDASALGKRVGDGFDHRMTYKYRRWDGTGEKPTGRNPSHLRATRLSAFDAETSGQNWSAFCGRYREAMK